MPPKKKGGKKKKSGKKSGKSSAGRASTALSSQEPKEEKLSDAGKSYFLVQVKDLEKRLIRLQRKCDELEIMNQHFSQQFDQLTSDKEAICDYLEKSLLQRVDEIAELNFDLNQLQEARDSEKDMYEIQIQQIRAELQDTKEQLTSENLILSGKLSSMEEFKAQKDDLMSKFAAIEEEMARVDRQHKDVVYGAERVAVVDKDRLKKEMVIRVSDLAAEFRKVSNKQMAETTKRTIKENADLNARLQRMSAQTMQLISENDVLRQKHKDLKVEIDLLETIEKELSRKNFLNNRTLKQLIDQCRDNETKLAEYESPEKDEELMNLQKDYESLINRLNSQNAQHGELEEDRQKLTVRLREHEVELASKKKMIRKMQKLIKDTRSALLDAQTLMEPDEEMTEAEMVEKRQAMLQSLLVLLNSATVLGLGPVPRQLGMQTGPFEVKPPSIASSVSRGSDKKTPEPMSLEKLSQFGLAPMPHREGSAKYSGDILRALSPMSRHGRVQARSKSVQAGDAKVLYAEKQLGQMPQGGSDLMRRMTERPARPAHTLKRHGVPATLF